MTATSRKRATTRRPMRIGHKQVQLLQVARNHLHMDQETYRAILRRVAGVESANDLNQGSFSLVMDEFKRLGFTYKPAPKARPVGENRATVWAKLEAQLKDSGRDLAYADAMAKRMCKVDAVRFCNENQLLKVIQALAIDQRRKHGREYRPGQPWPPGGE